MTMPDRATIEAATPKCPRKVTRGLLRPEVPCDRPLHWHHATTLWRCDEHGPQITAQALLAEQAAA